MADFAAPSFSLGLDLDVDSDALTEEKGDGDEVASLEGSESGRSPIPKAFGSGRRRRRFLQEREDGDMNYHPVEPIEVDTPVSTSALKRLKRGPPPSPSSETPRSPPAGPLSFGDLEHFSALDEDIEEFSSQEELAARDEYSSRHVSTACSSSKFFSLRGQRFLSTFSSRNSKRPVATPNSNASISASVEASSNKKVFPRLTCSPLKRIQLLDSDSDDLSIAEERCDDVKGASPRPELNFFTPTQCLSKSKKKQDKISTKPQNENLWEDFRPKPGINLVTPALNEFCEDYFNSVKNSDVGQKSRQHSSAPNDLGAEVDLETKDIGYGAEPELNFPDLQPPSHRYFYHSDVRIQELVRQRLHNFVPLEDLKFIGNQQRNGETLDYKGQFGQKKVPRLVRGDGEKAREGTSKSKSNNRKNAIGKDVEEVTGTWVTPKTCKASPTPKDAGKRRVHADGRSVGHWRTGRDGRKVYVTRNGQELSGRVAYRHYMKETGADSQSRKKRTGGQKKKAKR